MKEIILIGMSGAGKSTIALELSRKLNLKYVDTDDYIVNRYNSSIEEIFRDKGEAYFRKLEEASLKAILKGDEVVIATGGGIVLSDINRERLKNYRIIYLKARKETIYRNIINDRENIRPLLESENVLENIEKIMRDREQYYKKLSKHTVNVDGKSVDEIADEIIDRLENDSCS